MRKYVFDGMGSGQVSDFREKVGWNRMEDVLCREGIPLWVA